MSCSNSEARKRQEEQSQPVIDFAEALGGEVLATNISGPMEALAFYQKRQAELRKNTEAKDFPL